MPVSTRLIARTIHWFVTSGLSFGLVGVYFQWTEAAAQRAQLQLEMSKNAIEQQEKHLQLATQICNGSEPGQIAARLKLLEKTFGDRQITPAFCLQFRSAGNVSPHFVRPVPSRIPAGSGFGAREDPESHHYVFHPGLDFKGESGDPILSASDGYVVWVGPLGSYGNVVEINHANGWHTRYAHLSTITVRVLETVFTNQKLGTMGTIKNGEAQLHFEIWYNDKVRDPAMFLPQDESNKAT